VADVLIRFNGFYIFETIVGDMGLCFKPISPGDAILLVPGAMELHAISADRQKYVGMVQVQGWTEETILQLLPGASQRLEMFCVS
jgi:hypothetical protein